jgi:hypothetical protein
MGPSFWWPHLFTTPQYEEMVLEARTGLHRSDLYPWRWASRLIVHISTEFQERLEGRFNGRLRARWSPSRNEVHIEQKVRRGLVEGSVNVRPKNAEDRRLNEDELIRARDGYKLTMIVTPGTTRRCKVCNTEAAVPAFKSALQKCSFCAMKGRAQMEAVGFFPLSDSLIDYLLKLDLDTMSDRSTDAVHAHNDRLLQQRENDLYRPVEAAFRERYNRLVGIQQTGYTGKVFQG